MLVESRPRTCIGVEGKWGASCVEEGVWKPQNGDNERLLLVIGDGDLSTGVSRIRSLRGVVWDGLDLRVDTTGLRLRFTGCDLLILRLGSSKGVCNGLFVHITLLGVKRAGLVIAESDCDLVERDDTVSAVIICSMRLVLARVKAPSGFVINASLIGG